jgi:hypothetical protein
VQDNGEDVNQFEEISLFTYPMNIKDIEKDFDKNYALYMKRWQWKICMKIMYHISY